MLCLYLIVINKIVKKNMYKKKKIIIIIFVIPGPLGKELSNVVLRRINGNRNNFSYHIYLNIPHYCLFLGEQSKKKYLNLNFF